MSAEHTPTPWKVEKSGVIMDMHEAVVGTLLERPTQSANAAFIVRAVNAHDDLVAALKEANKLCDSARFGGLREPEGRLAQKLRMLIPELIAKAEAQ